MVSKAVSSAEPPRRMKRNTTVMSSSSSDDETEATERCKFKKREKGRGQGPPREQSLEVYGTQIHFLHVSLK